MMRAHDIDGARATYLSRVDDPPGFADIALDLIAYADSCGASLVDVAAAAGDIASLIGATPHRARLVVEIIKSMIHSPRVTQADVASMAAEMNALR